MPSVRLQEFPCDTACETGFSIKIMLHSSGPATFKVLVLRS